MPVLLENVSFGYQKRHPVFEALDWRMPSPGKTVLLGPNGAGKSTLLGLIAGAMPPQKGRVSINLEVDTESTTRADASALRVNVAWMPQSVYAVKGLSVHEQVALAAWLGGMSSSGAKDAARETLDMLNLNEFSDRRVETLSGGQLRRVGLAEALTRGTATVLLDEPTASLDPSQRENFKGLLTDLDCDLLALGGSW